jgi:translation initiation factor IF-2
MRVYEFAKTKNLSAKEVIELLRKEGFEISSHMAVLDQDALNFLEKKLSKLEPEKKVSRPNSTAPAPQKQEAPKKTTMEKSVVAYTKKHESLPKSEPKKIVKPLGLTAEAAMVSDVAEGVHKPVTEVILTLLKWGHVYTKNSMLPEELVVKLAKHYNVPVFEVEKKEETSLKKEVEAGEYVKDRLPVVVVVGHVDHGKTTLLDYIRKTRVAAKEKGGITQHLGAYEATTPQGNIVFLDTPGHEAFSKIRVRGVKVADIAVLVVAADDGVMPQTVEAIKHIQSMGVPVVVAINKVDKVDPSRIEVVKREISQHGLLPEDWGGDVICVPISAKLGKGVDQLLEMLLLQAQIMELRADTSGPAHGYVLEAKLEKGRGIVATIICQRGTLAVGDHFKAGATVGKVTSLVDSHGRRLQSVSPSIPVLVAGFESLPEAGDMFEVIDKDTYKKVRLALEVRKSFAPKATGAKDAFNIIVKTDTNSSKEALVSSIEKISKKLEKGYNIIQSGVGSITESDVMLASNTGSKIIALHVKPEVSAAQLAARLGVEIKLFEIIYKLLEDLEAVSESAKEIKKVKTKIGEAVVLKVFDIKNLGVIAGCYIKEGRFNKDGTVIVYRGNRKVGEGPIKSLQRERKQVKEAHAGYECGFLVDGFDAWQPDDRVECYLELPEGSK